MNVGNAVEWVPLESSVFTAVAYRAGAQQLYLQFQEGNVYRYFGPCITSCWQPNRRAGISLSEFGTDFVASGFVRISRAAGSTGTAVCVQQNNCVSLFS